MDGGHGAAEARSDKDTSLCHGMRSVPTTAWWSGLRLRHSAQVQRYGPTVERRWVRMGRLLYPSGAPLKFPYETGYSMIGHVAEVGVGVTGFSRSRIGSINDRLFH